MVIDAHYSIPMVLEIEGTAELYVDPPAGVWFFALGKPPHEKCLRARIFDLFESDSYFVISDKGLVTGSWVGYQNSWSFGPLSASLDAYLATEIAVQWSPLQVAGGIELHGEVQLEAFGVGITAGALLEATAPNPFWVYGSLQLELDPPWPLPNVGGTVILEWGPNGPAPPAPQRGAGAARRLDGAGSGQEQPEGQHRSEGIALHVAGDGGGHRGLGWNRPDPGHAVQRSGADLRSGTGSRGFLMRLASASTCRSAHGYSVCYSLWGG